MKTYAALNYGYFFHEAEKEEFFTVASIQIKLQFCSYILPAHFIIKKSPTFDSSNPVTITEITKLPNAPSNLFNYKSSNYTNVYEGVIHVEVRKW